MAQNDAPSGIAVVTWSMFESYVDLVNLLDAGPRMLLTCNTSLGREPLLQAAINFPDSPFSKVLMTKGLNDHETSVEQMLQHVRTQMAVEREKLTAEFMKRRRDPADPKAEVETSDRYRFVLSNHVDGYECVYRYLSTSAHGRVAALLDGVCGGQRKTRWPPPGKT